MKDLLSTLYLEIFGLGTNSQYFGFFVFFLLNMNYINQMMYRVGHVDASY